MADRYVNVDQVLHHIDNDGLLVGNNAEWAKEAVYKSEYVDLEYFIPAVELDRVINECRIKQSEYAKLGSLAQVECYTEFIMMLQSMWRDPDDCN